MSPLDSVRKLDRNTLVNLFDTYSHPLYEYAFRMCNDPLQSDRIVGDAFTRLLSRVSEVSEPVRKLRSYLFQVTYQRLREEEKTVSQSDGDLAELPSTSLPIRSNIWKGLTIEQRHIVVLRFLEGLSRAETATIMGKKVHQVKTIEYEAINILAEALGSQNLL